MQINNNIWAMNSQRMDELAIKAANETNGADERAYLQQEVVQLASELDRIGNAATFNERILLDGSLRMEETNTGAQGNINPKEFTSANTKVIIMEAVKAEQSEYGVSTAGGMSELKALLKDELVPNAVDAILNIFPDTFGYLLKFGDWYWA